jgi:hypothetical protein
MGNLNCKTCQCQLQTQNEKDIQEEFVRPSETTLFHIMDDDVRLCSEDNKRQLIEEAKNNLKNNVNFIYNFKSEPNWDLVFNQDDNKSATINGLFNLKKKINEFYDEFLNYNGETLKDTYFKKDLEVVKNNKDFLPKFKPLILKNMLNFFKIQGLDKKLKDYSIILSNDENLEIYNQIFKAPLKESFTNNFLSIPRVPYVHNSIHEMKSLEVIYESLGPESNRRSSVLTTKANTKETVSSKGILSSMSDFLKNLTISKKPTLEVIPAKPEDDIQKLKDEEKLKDILKLTGKNTMDKLEMLRCLRESKEYSASFVQKENSDTDISHNNKKLNKVVLKTKEDYELNKIQELYTKEEDNLIFISFKDKAENTFYEGYWHVIKNCKYGLGVEYKFGDNNSRYKYFGYFKDNMFHGLGMLLKEQNYSYIGEFRNGKFSGFGIEKCKAFTYQGFFKNNKYCGYGEYCFMKTSFTGCYLEGQKEGAGFAKFEDGCSYIGLYQNNLMHGVGLYKWPEGHSYYGGWKEDKKYGIGYHRWDSGHHYLGGYKNDLRDGNGEYTFNNGAKLKGTWINGKKEHIFELVDNTNKSTYQIVYRNDIQVDE